ncbi:dimethylaniline monooxygenase [Phyllobacterium salinisoli]|uniref:Trimethylamine monooxygenase n=1 Tax=Phyllobacterium salinisoli TaxID=1899321 RepID=A0A368K1D3_9HYPH|nr:NAD(P)-binding domain-containing protein [Phyllobacterium salinisoli]RCS23021.1 dimethylaniline monooxygenase [Phyllobacterium salinisoli]
MHVVKESVAVIGAGPGGLVTARWLAAHGFEPVLFEATDSLGGQWNAASTASATWSGMRTNTSRIMTAFSDLDHAPDVAVYPRQDQMLSYLEHYARKYDLIRQVRFGTRVLNLDMAGNGGWAIRYKAGGVEGEEIFRRVIVATGAQSAAKVPDVPGIESFAGGLGLVHTSQYDGPERFRGRTVVVAGGSISALEIASDLAFNGARVVSATRRQRYILPKLIAGIPTEHVMFTRAAALAGELLPPEAQAEGLKAAVLRAGGYPQQYGAPAPEANIFAAGITQSQSFLPAVAEGRIAVRPWIDRIDGEHVHFCDGTAEAADAILLATGYRLSLPWLAPRLVKTLALGDDGMDLHAHTFHPALPGLAFVGLYNLIGPYLPVLELQARWVAYMMAGLVPPPTSGEMEEGLRSSREMRARGQQPVLHALAVMLARKAGVEPDLREFPQLERALLFGPLSAVSFRLQGPDCLDDAADRIAEAAAAFGAICGEVHTPEENQLRRLLGLETPVAA